MQATTQPTIPPNSISVGTIIIDDNLASGPYMMHAIEARLVKGPDLELGVPPGQEYLFLEWKHSGQVIKRQHFNSNGVATLRQLLGGA